MNGQKVRFEQQNPEGKVKQRVAIWETRLINTIEKYRKEIGILSQIIITKQPCRRLTNKATYITNKYRNAENQNEVEVLDLLKQKLAIKANRLRRYRDCNMRKQQNSKFKTDQRAFYRQLNAQKIQVQEIPQKEEIVGFWERIWSHGKTHRTDAKWLREEKQKTDRIPNMTDCEITTQDIKEAIRKVKNWKSPGKGGLHNFWQKKFHALHEKMANVFNAIVLEPDETPHFFTHGETYLLPKTTTSTHDASQYRPITCHPP